jgi:hypothetical protein
MQILLTDAGDFISFRSVESSVRWYYVRNSSLNIFQFLGWLVHWVRMWKLSPAGDIGTVTGVS